MATGRVVGRIRSGSEKSHRSLCLREPMVSRPRCLGSGSHPTTAGTNRRMPIRVIPTAMPHRGGTIAAAKAARERSKTAGRFVTMAA